MYILVSYCGPISLRAVCLARIAHGGAHSSFSSRESQSKSSRTSDSKMEIFPWLSNIYRWRIYLWIVSYALLGWPYVPFSQDVSWPGFLYCQKYLGFGFVCVCRPIGVWRGSLCFRNASRGTLNQSNIEILARMRPGKMAHMVTLCITENSKHIKQRQKHLCQRHTQPFWSEHLTGRARAALNWNYKL